jgi:outer membrane protein assembly factor BamB
VEDKPPIKNSGLMQTPVAMAASNNHQRRQVPILLAVTVGVVGLAFWADQGRRSASKAGGFASATDRTNDGPGAWPQGRANAQNTGQASVPGPATPYLKWRSPELQVTQGSGAYEAPVIARDGTLFCAIGPLVQAVRRDGSIRWSYVVRAKEQVRGGLAVSPNGTLLVPTESAATDMPGLWELLHWNQKSEPGLYALDPTGHLLWKYSGGNAVSSPVVDGQGRIYLALDNSSLGSPEGRLVVLSPQGHLIQQWTVPTDSFGAIVLWERKGGPWIYYLTSKRDFGRKLLYLMRPGQPIRKADVPAPGVCMWGLSLSQSKRALYGPVVGDGNSNFLYSIDPINLRVKWRYQVKGEVNAWPVVTADAVYVGTCDTYHNYPEPESVTHHHTLCAIRHDGKLSWKRTLDGEINTSPAADKLGDVYLTLRSEKDRNNYLLCLRPNGTERWRAKLASPLEPLSPPVIGDQQTVYCYGQRAYAVGNAGPVPAMQSNRSEWKQR